MAVASVVCRVTGYCLEQLVGDIVGTTFDEMIVGGLSVNGGLLLELA